MTYITQLIGRKAIFSSRLLTMLLTGFVLVLLQSNAVQAQWTTGTDISNTNSGNVGIGVSSPGAKLDVQRNDGSDLLVRAQNSSTSSGAAIFRAAAASNGNEAARLELTDNAGYNGGISADHNNGLIFKTGNQSSTYSAMGTRMTITTAGNVGVGTTTPGDKLVTVGNVLGGNITSHTQLYSSYDSQANVVMELGYGTATANIVPYPSLVLSKNLTSTSNLLGSVQFANSSIADGSEKRIASIAAWTDGATNSGVLSFNTTNVGTINERMRISSAGNVGIGTTTPTAKVHIISADDSVAPALSIRQDSNPLYGFDFALDTNVNGNLSVNRINNGVSANFLTFDRAGGNVGIGTAGPTESVHVRKDQNAATHVLAENVTGGNAAQVDFQAKNDLGHSAQFG